MTTIDLMNANYTSSISISEMDQIELTMRELNARDVEEVRREFDER